MERTGEASRDLGRGGSALVLGSKKIPTGHQCLFLIKEQTKNVIVGGCAPASSFLPIGVTGGPPHGDVLINV